MNKRDRKGKAEIESCNQYKTPEEFWQALTGKEIFHFFTIPRIYFYSSGISKKPEEPIFEHIPQDRMPERKRLYEVQLGMGFLELPQVELKHGVLHKEFLKPKSVFVLDCSSELFLWIGKNTNRLTKMAGQVCLENKICIFTQFSQKIVSELHRMIERPDYCVISRENEDEESTIFRSKFMAWDDIVPFDFTMTADTVQRRGADIKVGVDL